MIHSILIVGQSNMAGRGSMKECELITNTNILVMRNGIFREMFRPVNPDRITAGTCLAESFADEYSKDHPDVSVGIIPCADGGTCIDQWQVGGLLYDNAIYASRLAMRTSHIVAILWHQGESDCNPNRAPIYEEKCFKVMKSMRDDLGLNDVPLIMGALGNYLVNYTGGTPCAQFYQQINASIEKITKRLPLTAFVDANGLTSNPDNLHFNTTSLYEFGKRYYAAFRELEDKNKVFCEKSDAWNAIRGGLEHL